MIKKTRQLLRTEIKLLNLQVNKSEKVAQRKVVHYEAVELVPVNRQVTPAAKFPAILLENFDPDQVRHDFGQPLVMVAFHPNHLDIAPGIRELADVAKKLPVFFFQTTKVQIAENVPQ